MSAKVEKKSITTISRETVEKICQDSIENGGGGQFMMSSTCHNGAPLFIVGQAGTGKLTIICAWCGHVQADILIGRASIIHIPAGKFPPNA